MKFSKYHALGNDYLVIDPKDAPSLLTEAQIRVICHRNFGVGSDGILLGPLPAEQAEFALRIFNADGSEAGEDSGDQVQPDRRDRIAAVRLPAQPDGLADEPGQLPGDREEAGLGQPLIVGTPVGSGQFRRELVGLGAGFGPACRIRATPH